MALTVSNYLGMLQADPEDEQAFEGLKDTLRSGNASLVGDEPVRLVEAARIGHEKRGELRAAAWLIEIEADLIRGDPDLEAALWKELGRLHHEELLQDEQAAESYQRALRLRPGDEEAQMELERIQNARATWRKLADRLAEEGKGATDAALRASLLTSAASLVWQHRDQTSDEESDALFKIALESDPSDPRPVRLFAQTLRDRQRWHDLSGLFLTAASHLRKRDEKINLYLQAGRVAERNLEDAEQAATSYQQVLDFAPGQPEALRYLVKYFTEREHWDDLVRLYEQALESRHTLESEQGILMQLGMVHWRFRNAPFEAEPYFARLRKIDPSHPSVLAFYREAGAEDRTTLLDVIDDAQRVERDPGRKLELAIELAREAQRSDDTSERAIEAWRAVQRLDPDHAEARQALKALYRRLEKWPALVEVMRAEMDSLSQEERGTRLSILRELVPIYRDQLRLDIMVLNTYRAIVEEAPDDEEALSALANTYEELGRWNELIRILGMQAETATDPGDRIGFYLRIADLWIDRFANYKQATAPLEAILDLAPGHREAVRRLKEIYSKKRQWASLFEVLHKEMEQVREPTEALSLKRELAGLASERLHDNARALALWRAILEAEPQDGEALNAVERLAERERDVESLAMALATRVRWAETTAEKVTALVRLGELRAGQLGDSEGAAETYRAVLELDPKNAMAMRALREAYLAAGDWENLEALFRDDWVGLIEALSSAAESTGNVDQRIELCFRAASIVERNASDPDAAQRYHEQVLTADPRNVQAARALAPIYERRESFLDLVDVLEILFEGLGDEGEEDERVALAERICDLLATHGDDPDAAFAWASRAFALRPNRASVRDGLERAAQAAGAFGPLLSLYRGRIQDAGPDEQSELRRRIAVLAADQLGDAEEAIAQLSAVLEEHPRDEEAIEALARLYRNENRLVDLRDLYLLRLKHAEDKSERAELLRTTAELEELHLEDAEAAARHYAELDDEQPDDPGVLTAMDRLYSQLNDHEALAHVLRRRIERASASDVVELTNRLGNTCLARGDAQGALDAFGEVLRRQIDHTGAIAGLESVADRHSDVAIDAGRWLERAYEALGDLEKLTTIIKARIEQTTDEDEKRALGLRLADLDSQLGDTAGAYSALETAFLDRPDDPELWTRLTVAAERAGKYDELAQAFATAIEAGDLGEEEAAELAARTADVYDELLGMPEKAEPYHRRVLACHPLSDKSFEALKQLFTRQESWKELEKLYQQRIEDIVDADSKLDLLLRVCFLNEEMLEDVDAAMAAYRRVLDLDPDHDGARHALERMYRSTERYALLAELLTHNLDRAQGEERIEILADLGNIHARHLNQSEAAVDHFEQILQSDPAHAVARDGLRGLIDVEDQRLRIAELLEFVYESQEAFDDLSTILEVKLEGISDRDRRIDLLERIAEIHETHRRDDSAALETHARAVALDPGRTDVRERLRRAAERTNGQMRRAEVLEAALQQSTDLEPFVAAELWRELAVLLDDVLGDRTRAEHAYQKLIEIDAENSESVLFAARALERIHMASEEHAALAEDLRWQIKFETDPEQCASLLQRLSDLLEMVLEDIPGAIAAHRDRMDLTPINPDVMRALQRLYQQTEDWPNLIAILHSYQETIDDPDEQRALGQRIGAIYVDHLADPENAVVAYNEVVERLGDDRETLAALIDLYEKTERYADLLDVLERQIELTEDRNEQAQLSYRAAQLMRTKTGELDRAVESYVRVLRADSAHEGARQALLAMIDDVEPGTPIRVAAARAILPFIEATDINSQWLINVLEVIGESDDPTEAVHALRRAAEAAEIAFDLPDRAFELMGHAVRAGISDEALATLLGSYRRLAEASSRWDDYVTLLQSVVDDILDGDLQTDTLLDMAVLCRDRLDKKQDARDFFARVLDNRPEHTEALDALDRLHGEARQHAAQLEIVRRKTDLADEAERRAELYLRQAEISDEKLSDGTGAIHALDQSLAEHETLEAYERLERLYRGTEAHQELADLYERQLVSKLGDEIQTRYRLGEVCVRQLDEKERAIEHLRRVIEANPDHEAAAALLQELMREADHKATAAEILAPIFTAKMDWESLIAALEAMLEAETELARRKDLLSQLARVHEDHLGQPKAALEQYARQFQEDPADRDVWSTLSRLAADVDEQRRLAEIYSAAITERGVIDETMAQLAHRAASLHREHTRDLVKAAELLQALLEFEPTNATAFDELIDVFTTLRDWPALLELYRRAADLAPSDDQRVSLLQRRAAIYQHEVGDIDAAIEAYRDILDVSADDLDALAAFEGLLRNQGRFVELADHLRSRLERSSGGSQELELKHRLGTVLRERLDDTEAALDLFDEVVQVDFGHQATVQALEALQSDSEHALRVSEILELVYRQAEQWDKLIALFELRVPLHEDAADQVRLLNEIGLLAEEREQAPEQAFEAYERAFVLDPYDDQVKSSLARLADALDAWAPYVEAHERAIRRSNDPAAISEMLTTIARTQDEKLGDPRAAIEVYRRLADHDPDDPAALDALELLHTMVGDWRGLCDVLLRQAQQVLEPSQRGELFRRAGSVYEDQLGDRRRAIDVYQQALAEDDCDVESLAALDALYAQSERNDELVIILCRRLELEDDPEVRTELGMRLGNVLETRLGQAEEAIEAYRQVLDDAPDHEVAIESLGRLYEAQHMSSDLLDNLRMRAERAADEATRLGLWFRAGQVLERDLSDLSAAIDVYRDVLAVAPNHDESLQALLRITRTEAHHEAAADILLPLLNDQQRWDDLASVLECKARFLVDPIDKRVALRRLAEVHEQGREDREGAFEALSRALAEDPADAETLEELARFAEQLGWWDRFANECAARASSAVDPLIARSLYVRLAQVAETRLDNATRAAEAYRRALESVDDDPEILAELDRLFDRLEAYDELAEVLERRIQRAVDPEEQRAMWLRLGAIRQQQLGDAGGAYQAYQEALELEPTDETARTALWQLAGRSELADEVLATLEQAYRQTDDAEKLAEVYEARVERTEDDHQRARLLREAAELYERRMERPAQALELLRRALILDPRDALLVEEMERLAELTDGWESLRGLVESIPGDASLRRDLHLRAAGWYRDRMEDPGAAERCLREAIQADVDAVEAHADLVALLRAPGREEDRVPALRAWARVELDPDQRSELLREAAEVAENALGLTDVAAECLDAILQHDPTDPQALRDLSRIRLGEQRWSQAAELLGRRIEVEADGVVRVDLRQELADLLAGRLHDPERAIEAYQELLLEEPTHTQANVALDGLYTSAKRWDDVRDLIEQRLGRAESDAERIELRVRLARLSEEAFGQVEEAMDQLYAILEIEPQHRGALSELERLYLREERWSDLCEVRRRMADAMEGEARIDMLESLASTYEEKLEEPARAVAVHEEILELDERRLSSLHALLRLHEATKNWSDYEDAVLRVVPYASAAEGMELLLRLSEVAANEFGSTDSTERYLLQAQALDPESPIPRQRLEQHYQVEAQHQKLAELLVANAKVIADPKRKVSLLVRAAELYRGQLDDIGRAAGALEQAAELTEDRDVLMPLCDLYFSAGRQADAVPVLERIIASFGVRRVRELAQYHHRLGQALEGSGQPEAALEQYDKAFQIDLTNVPILRDRGILAYQSDDLDRAYKTFRALLLQKLGDDAGIAKADIYYYLGDIHHRQGDRAKAISMLERALTEQREHPQAAALLADVRGSSP